MNKKYQMEQEYKKYKKLYERSMDRGLMVKPLIPETAFNRIYEKAAKQVKIQKRALGESFNPASIASEVRKELVNYVSQSQADNFVEKVSKGYNELSPESKAKFYQEDRELTELILNTPKEDLIRIFRGENRYDPDSHLYRFHTLYKRLTGKVYNYDTNGEVESDNSEDNNNNNNNISFDF